jgi:hypothetical protein
MQALADFGFGALGGDHMIGDGSSPAPALSR